MRLICPNCGAEYEVPDDVVPEAGRDVQCSACGQTWFATPEGVSPPEAVEAPSEVTEAPSEAVETSSDAVEASPETIEDTPPFRDDDRLVADPESPDPDDLDHDPDSDAPVPDPAQPATRRQLDPSVADVLRQERDTSTALKRSEFPDYDAPETEPETGEDGTQKAIAAAAAASAAAATGSVISRARSESPRPDAASQLPDVDEINSTLRPDGRKSERRQQIERSAQAKGTKSGRRGFRLGFLLVLLIALIGWLVYWQAPMLAERFPGAAVKLGEYVIAVDNARLWLDQKLASLTGGA